MISDLPSLLVSHAFFFLANNIHDGSSSPTHRSAMTK